MAQDNYGSILLPLPKVAEILNTGTDFVARRTNPKHPDFIPNVKLGRNRFVRMADLDAWIDARRVKAS